jgi:hypothetical protein
METMNECKRNDCIKKKNPLIEIIVYENLPEKYCGVKCKNEMINTKIKELITNGNYIEKNIMKCSLCTLDNYFLMEMECKHNYCNICILNIINDKMQCPICKTLLNTILIENEDKTIETEQCLFEMLRLVNKIREVGMDQVPNLREYYFKKNKRDVEKDIDYIINNLKIL